MEFPPYLGFAIAAAAPVTVIQRAQGVTAEVWVMRDVRAVTAVAPGSQDLFFFKATAANTASGDPSLGNPASGVLRHEQRFRFEA